MLLNPYFLLAALLSLLASFGGGYWLGTDHCETGHKAEQFEVMQEIQVAADKQAEEDNQIAQRYEDVREVVRTVYVKVKEEANENIDKNGGYADCSLDADGLLLYNSRPPAAPGSAGGTDGRLPKPP